jgi:hypothetical protein
MADCYIINTDWKTVGDAHPVDIWFEKRIAVTGGDDSYRKLLSQPKPGDTCLMYQSRQGVIGVGEVPDDAAVVRAEEPIYYASPGQLKQGESEYHLDVRWWTDRRRSPITAEVLASEWGIRITPHPVRRLGVGSEGITGLIECLRAADERKLGDPWTEKSFFAEAMLQAPQSVSGLRRLLDDARSPDSGLTVQFGAGNSYPRFIIRLEGSTSGDLVVGRAEGRITIDAATIREWFSDSEPVLGELWGTLGSPEERSTQREPSFDAERLDELEVGAKMHALLRWIARRGAFETTSEVASTVGTLLGVPYRPASELVTASVRALAEFDSDKVDRGVRAHARVQNALAAYLREQGLEPRSSCLGTALFDLAWSGGGETYVAEVKSITAANEEKQLRLGLGQVLRYRHQMASSGKRVVAVLVVEREPRDALWSELCRELGVALIWPDQFARIASYGAGAG